MRESIKAEASPSGDELDQVFGQANPNPGRVGCPSPAVRGELARRQRPIEDPLYLHLASCSECYSEVRALQASFAQSAAASRTSAFRVLAAAAAILVLAGGAWFVAGRGGQSISAPPPAAATLATLDLRRHEVQRGGQDAAPPDPMVLSRGRVHLTILLPTASEPGAYDFELVDEARNVHAPATGNATLQDFVTTLPIDVNLSALRPGRYELGVRRQGEDWRFFVVTIH